MSGHNKWSTIKRKKGANDAKRGAMFSKLIKAISLAARDGGGDPATNNKLRTLIDKAKSINMPSDTLTRSIKRGTGEIEGAAYEELSYEGYGPAGIAVLVDCVTDNRNRTIAEVRHAFSKHGGTLGESGCVQWMFDKKGVILIPAEGVDEDTLMELALENGADECEGDTNFFKVTSGPAEFDTLRDAIEKAGYTIDSAQISMEPQTTIKVDESDAGKILRLMNALEDCEDVQEVYSNFDIPDEIMEKLAD